VTGYFILDWENDLVKGGELSFMGFKGEGCMCLSIKGEGACGGPTLFGEHWGKSGSGIRS